MNVFVYSWTFDTLMFFVKIKYVTFICPWSRPCQESPGDMGWMILTFQIIWNRKKAIHDCLEIQKFFKISDFWNKIPNLLDTSLINQILAILSFINLSFSLFGFTFPSQYWSEPYFVYIYWYVSLKISLQTILVIFYR